jgi:hypothetical protein
MQLDFNDIIERLKKIQRRFNASEDSTKRYALIQALNHIAEKELPIHGHWEDIYREGMLRKHGAKGWVNDHN